MVALEQNLESMETTVLPLEQCFKTLEPHTDQLSNGKRKLTRKRTMEVKKFPQNGTKTVETAEMPNFFSRKLEEFESQFQSKLAWKYVIMISSLHIIGVICILIMLPIITLKTFSYTFVSSWMVCFGVTGGVHRLWTHRTYTANLPLRIILMILFAMSGQNKIFHWVRDHRLHHKYSETSTDPHNAKRGFFFSHVGWLMCHRLPEVLEKGRTIDMSDVLADPVATFHDKYHNYLKVLFCFVLPTLVPIYCWNETFFVAFTSQVFLRYLLSLNFTWFVNSAAHLWGNKPYDRLIGPVQNWWVSVLTMGEGWHNYHHTFPWDYKAEELGPYFLNFTTMWIEIFAWIGWATDLKTASPNLIKSVVERRGDGSHRVHRMKEEKDL